MKVMQIAMAVLVGMGVLGAQSVAEEPEPSVTPADCQLGPIEKGFGRSDWLVYGCDDGASLYILARSDNPARGSYFTFTKHEGGYSLRGEGKRKKKITKAAFEDLSFLSADDILTLYIEVAASVSEE